MSPIQQFPGQNQAGANPNGTNQPGDKSTRGESVRRHSDRDPRHAAHFAAALWPLKTATPVDIAAFTMKPLICLRSKRIRSGRSGGPAGLPTARRPRYRITGVAGMEHAGPTELTFLANPKYAPKVKHTRAGAILVSQPLAETKPASLVSANPYLDFARALALFYQPPRPQPGIHPQASIAATATIGEGRVHRAVRGGGRARHHRPQRGAASARGDL